MPGLSLNSSLHGATERAGLPIDLVHLMRSIIQTRALEGGPDPRPLLSLKGLSGNLIENQRAL
jgi:hypothetical protein